MMEQANEVLKYFLRKAGKKPAGEERLSPMQRKDKEMNIKGMPGMGGKMDKDEINKMMRGK